MKIEKLIREHESLASKTTFKTGGKARYFCEVQSLEELKLVLKHCKDSNIPYFLLGKGSNLVVSDSGYHGMVIHLAGSLAEIQFSESVLTVGAGALLHTTVIQSVRKGLSGIEHLAGIPGTIGGGTYINAGAFGQELGDCIAEVFSLDSDGNEIHRTQSQCNFGYRHSIFTQKNEVIYQVKIKLQATNCNPDTLKQSMDETLKKRKSKQPLELPNAGSMFKRPAGTYAGKLIEEANLKGFRYGGAQISPKHANFVVNVQNASAQDIHCLSMQVIEKVFEHSGIQLEREVIFLGDFAPCPKSQ